MYGKKDEPNSGETATLKLFQKISDERVLELQREINREEKSKTDGNKLQFHSAN